MLILWLAVSYVSGSLPWSVWLGRWFFQVDPRDQRDHNPGAANAFRVAGWRLGLSVLLLDFLKALLPVAAARWLLMLPGQQLLWIALMPMVGHALSIFLRLRGGRGIVVMFGVWAGLTLYQIPMVMGLTAIGAVLLTRRDEYRTLAIPVVLLAYLLVTRAPTWMLALASGQLLILLLKIATFVLQSRSQPTIGTD